MGFMKLPTEITTQIFLTLPDLRTVIALRGTCRLMRSIYLLNETAIRNRFRDRLVAAVKYYYNFLATLYVDESSVRNPPLDGWPNIPLGSSDRRDGDFVVEVARHLPYIRGASHLGGNSVCALHSCKIEYNCIPIDHSPGFHRCVTNDRLRRILRLYATHPAEHCIELARACRTDGHSLYLDTMTGTIIDDVAGMTQDRTTERNEIAAYLEERIERFKNLAYVAVGYNVYEVEQEEPGEFEHIDPDSAGPEPDPGNLFYKAEYAPYAILLHQRDCFPTRLDLSWVRRIYRKYGWPGPDYRKEEALKAVREYYSDRMDSSAPMCFELTFP